MGKSKSQIQRMIRRAQERGEEYIPPKTETNTHNDNTEEKKGANNNATTDSGETPQIKLEAGNVSKSEKLEKAALKLKQELDIIQKDEKLRAKERRSQKRKAEAIAAEAAGCSVEKIQEYFEQNKEALTERQIEAGKKNATRNATQGQQHRTPYIVFVGQLAFSTTKEGLFEHIKKELADERKISNSDVNIRLLTDSKTKKSRGMAFVELSDPELMYACLRLHHTLLEGRRINVERSAGGRSKEKRQSKIKQFREQQQEYLSNVVDNILADYIKSGELQEGELDEGAVALCKRHTAALVEAAIKQYIENNGREMDNTSAYFTFLLTKLAADKADGSTISSKPEARKGDHSERERANEQPRKKPKTPSSSAKSSLPGVDFSFSENQSDSGHDMAKIFPSLSRGRGRGRGYM